MKNQMLLYMLIVSLSSFNYWPLQSQISSSEKKLQPTKTTSSTMNNTIRKIKYYHVEETVSLKFGGYKSEYDVTNPNIINTYDLGPNGTRIITAIYEDEVQPEKLVLKPDTILNVKKTGSLSISDAPKKDSIYAYIDIIKTYERVSDQGYESIEMLKKLGNSYFFNDEFEKAEKCYNKLFNITANLEPDFYYRYSIILKSMGNIQKSEEFLKKFQQLSSITSRQ
ncbi:tetratricopeptide repeat protein [Flavobacterium sp. WC2509]|uniref:tetratricopeptide repeat protein n=1 Tax=Flavobacterium sp. WC2509 TaxID=3461406 RepID=UPI0040451215